MLDFLEFPKNNTYELIIKDDVFNEVIRNLDLCKVRMPTNSVIENSNFVERKIANTNKLSDMPKSKADVLKQLRLGAKEINQIRLNQMLEIRDFLNQQYPPNVTDFIKDLEWKKNEREYISESDIHFAVAHKCIESNRYGAIFYFGSKHSEYKTDFETMKKAQAWANEQYKEKLKEVLGV